MSRDCNDCAYCEEIHDSMCLCHFSWPERIKTPIRKAESCAYYEYFGGELKKSNDTNDGEYAVRRLLPCECAALQGFPKDWCDDVPHSDSAEYKLWGNGIALPSILGIMQNAVKVIKTTK